MMPRTVIITGASSGIGKAAALKFAIQGYNVIMACRDMAKSLKVRDSIIAESQNKNIDLMELDLSSFDSVQNFSKLFNNKYKKLDILVHNAGYFCHGHDIQRLNSDGIDLIFAVNAVAPFLLTHLLKNNLLLSEDARVLSACTVNIKNFHNLNREINLGEIKCIFHKKSRSSAHRRYGDSKMALLMLMFKMAEEFKKDNIKINTIMIPSVQLEKASLKRFRSFYRVIATLQNPYLLSPKVIADLYYHVCTSNEYQAITGKLINKKNKIVQPLELSKTKNFLEKTKKILSSSYYPSYADDKKKIEDLWKFTYFCVEKYMMS